MVPQIGSTYGSQVRHCPTLCHEVGAKPPQFCRHHGADKIKVGHRYEDRIYQRLKRSDTVRLYVTRSGAKPPHILSDPTKSKSVTEADRICGTKSVVGVKIAKIGSKVVLASAQAVRSDFALHGGAVLVSVAPPWPVEVADDALTLVTKDEKVANVTCRRHAVDTVVRITPATQLIGDTAAIRIDHSPVGQMPLGRSGTCHHYGRSTGQQHGFFGCV
jgi:hypothetical protein